MPIRRLALPAAVLVLIAATLIALAPRSATRALAAARPVPAALETIEQPAPQQAAPVRVAIKPLEPFVAKTDTRYTGFSIELWDEIARRNKWTTSYVWYDTLPPMLEDVSASKVDVGIAGISITRERETRLDFSHPMFNAGLQILAAQRSEQPWYARLASLASPTFGLYLLGLIFVIFVAGNVVWLFNRHHGYTAGVGYGMFRAAAVGLVGEVGDPERPIGQFASVLWVIVGICFVSLFTASLTTELTIQQITGGISGVGDLGNKRVVTVQGSTAARFLADRKIGFEGLATADEAFERLDSGDADAMVFDAPVLQHHVQRSDSDRLILVGSVFQREDYGIALPTGSPLRKSVNETLLEMRSDGSYDRIYEYYFGRAR